VITTWRSSHAAYREGAVEPAWLATLRRDALACFEKVGFPAPRDEAWRYTSLQVFKVTPFVHQDVGANAQIDALVAAQRLPNAVAEIVIVNGRIDAARSRYPTVAGLTVRPLSAAVASDDTLPQTFGRLAPWRDVAFIALNTAFVQDGVVVQVARGADIAGPVHVILASTGGAQPIVANPRLIVQADAGSRASVIVTVLGVAGATSLTNLVEELQVGANAELHHHVLALQPANASLMLNSSVRVERDGRYHALAAWLGEGLVRHEPRVVLAEPGASAHLDGLYVLDGSAHADNRVVVEHVAPRCISRQTYKGVMSGRSKGVFDGTVIVHRDAQHTDASQDSRNVLLSEDAEANAKPRLEIYADDVKCAHGTTVGRLDPEQLNYLRTRGIGLADARRVLTAAFVAEVVERLRDEPARDRLRGHVDARLNKVMEAR
jgi:Fe-S cluster assembly protein SufD